MKEVLTEGLAREDAKSIIKEFVEFVKKKLELPSLPRILLQKDSKRSVETKSFGGYGGNTIILTITNRHINDCLRTLAHELVHYRQDLAGEINANSGKAGSPEENEANAMAAVIMREWGAKHPQLFSYSAVE